MDNTNVVFQCSKCEHLLFVNNVNKAKLKSLLEMDCPSCGEDGHGNWVLLRMGSYDKEYGDK